MAESVSNANPPIHPQVTSYDSGYEYSLEYWTFLRRLVEEEDGGWVETTEEAEVLVCSAAG